MTIDNDVALPKEIDRQSAKGLIGESVYWYCNTCRCWLTSEITADGTVICPICGNPPAWEKNPPTLAYQSRRERIERLCADAEWRNDCERRQEQYADFINATYTGLPLRTKQSGWQSFLAFWKRLDELAEYLLLAKDSPNDEGIDVYSDAGLQRKYHDPRRQLNMCSFSDVVTPEMVKSGCTLAETVESISRQKGLLPPHHSDLDTVALLSKIKDDMERSIAYDFSCGYGKRDIERKYGLSERRVRTIVAHLAKALKTV